jgi:hypothetical protein
MDQRYQGWASIGSDAASGMHGWREKNCKIGYLNDFSYQRNRNAKMFNKSRCKYHSLFDI